MAKVKTCEETLKEFIKENKALKKENETLRKRIAELGGLRKLPTK